MNYQVTHHPFPNKILPALPEQIVRVEASSNYSKIFLMTGKPIIVAKVLRVVQIQLPGHMFVRVHRSHLINKMYVQQLNIAGRNEMLLTNGDIIVISRRRKNSLKLILKETLHPNSRLLTQPVFFTEAHIKPADTI